MVFIVFLGIILLLILAICAMEAVKKYSERVGGSDGV